MNVKELKELIKNMPDDLKVLTATDDEGNGFRQVPTDWCSIEKFTADRDLVAQEDYEEYDSDELTDYLLIG